MEEEEYLAMLNTFIWVFSHWEKMFNYFWGMFLKLKVLPVLPIPLKQEISCRSPE